MTKNSLHFDCFIIYIIIFLYLIVQMKSPDSLSTISISTNSAKKQIRFYKKKFIKNRSFATVITKKYYHKKQSLFKNNDYNKGWNAPQARKQTLFWLKFLIQLLNFNKTTYWISLQILLQLEINGEAKTCKKTAISLVRLSVKYNEIKINQQSIKINYLLSLLECNITIQQLLQTEHSIYRGLQFKLPISKANSYEQLSRQCLDIEYDILKYSQG